MENVVNAGALQRETRGSVPDEPEHIRTVGVSALPAVVTDDPDELPREHVRSPGLRRHGAKLAMTAAAVIGAAAGARLLFSEAARPDSLAQVFSGTFGAVFLRQTLLGAAFLAAELLLGLFAFGDLVVWTAPFLYGAGTVLRAACSAKLLPGSLIALAGVVIGAAISAEMSVLLLKLTRGGTVYMDPSPRRSYALGFLGCLAAIVLGAILMSAYH